MNILAILLIAITLIGQSFGLYCPSACSCSRRTVRCIQARLTTIPKIPTDTTILDLRFNQFNEISSDAFRGLTQVHTIFLSDNQIGVIQEGAFASLTSLRYLYMGNNRLTKLQDGVFNGATQLQNVFLERNSIWELDPNAFSNLLKLEMINLSFNKITSIPYETFKNLPNLKRLRLDGNPIACDCGVSSLLQKTSQRIQIDLVCESPPNSRGLAFNQLKEEDFHCIPPQIIQEPHDISPLLGETIELICVINGDPAPQIIWIRNTEQLSPTPRTRILPNGSLLIEQVRSDDNGIYECIGRNEVGETRSRPVRIVVTESHQQYTEAQTESYSRLGSVLRFINNPPSELQVGTNDEIVLHCATNDVAQIQWYFNGRQLSHSTQMTKVHTNGTLVVTRASLRNAGTYQCEAFNDHGRIYADVNVRINELPEFIITLESQTVTAGTTLYLECDADGDPIPTLSWKINGKPISEATTGTASSSTVTNRISLHNENTELEIENVTVADSGQYTCVAENSKGRREVTAEITVENPQGPPRLQFEPYNMDAFTGTTIELPCKAEGDAPPQVKWRKDGRLIPADSTVKYKISSSGSLYVQNITAADAGRYECSIFNEFGRTTASGFVKVKSNEVLAPGDRYVKIAFAEASKEIDLAINNTIDTLFSKNKQQQNPNQTRPNYGDLLRVFRFPTGEARQLARAAEIYERTLVNIRKHVRKGENLTMEATDFEYKELLSPEHLHLVAELSGCMQHRLMPNCTDMCYHAKYRTIDGTCNNMNNPTWGASLTAFRRIEKPVYENGFSMPVGWTKGKLYNGHEKPLARLISTTLISTKEITSDNQITHMTMQWGQFLDHDLDHAIPSVSSETWDGVDCKKTCEYAAPCFPMDVPQNDPRVLNRRCIDFVRSSSICGSGMTSIFFDSVQQREQINQLTSYIDASQVYGYSQQFANDLRNLTTEDGLLRAGVSFPGQKPSLPFAAPQDGIDCRRNLDESKMNCFVAGDIRVNEQIGLLAMHTIWMREHNRIASQLKKMNKHWSGDTIYNEARKIVGAQMQHVTYKHWLPIILGNKGMEMLGEYKGYNPNLNPSISNEFATAALRFGHSLINPILHRFNASYLPIPQGNLQLHKAFFAPWRLAYEGGVDPLMRGLFSVPAKLKTPDQNLNSDLTEKLFQTAHAVALDLAAMNIQRGRDHGIPSYNQYRKFCNLSEAKSFDDLKNEIISEEVRGKLEEIYGHPENIDIWVGGILEEQVDGGKVGPLFRCLLIEQFRRLRDGDRFYYENPSVFMPEQLQQIKQANLGRVLCDNGDNITEVTENIFMLPSTQGGYKQCEEITGINLYFWQECQTCNNLSPLLSSYVPQTYPKRSKRSVGSTYADADDADADENVIAEEEMKEERISGLEEVISSFQKELKKLRKKIHRLEESCQVSSDDDGSEERIQQQQQQPLPIKGRHHCHDSNGMKRLNNEVWDQDACTKCECKHSEVTCIREKCPELTCPNGITPIHNTNDCCPHCPLLLGTKLNITVDSV